MTTMVDRGQSITTNSVVLCPGVARRTFLHIANSHATQDLWINLAGGTAAANGSGSTFIAAKGHITFQGPGTPNGVVTGIASGASTPVVVQSME